jgi:hypothetical protein
MMALSLVKMREAECVSMAGRGSEEKMAGGLKAL